MKLSPAQKALMTTLQNGGVLRRARFDSRGQYDLCWMEGKTVKRRAVNMETVRHLLNQRLLLSRDGFGDRVYLADHRLTEAQQAVLHCLREFKGRVRRPHTKLLYDLWKPGANFPYRSVQKRVLQPLVEMGLICRPETSGPPLEFILA